MTTARTPVTEVIAHLAAHPRVVLAVSGGVDSMSLMHAVARARADGRLASHVVVATFDHGTGEHASRATALVRREALARGFPVRSARAARLGRGEAEWRDARWAFLREVGR